MGVFRFRHSLSSKTTVRHSLLEPEGIDENFDLIGHNFISILQYLKTNFVFWYSVLYFLSAAFRTRVMIISN